MQIFFSIENHCQKGILIDASHDGVIPKIPSAINGPPTAREGPAIVTEYAGVFVSFGPVSNRIALDIPRVGKDGTQHVGIDVCGKRLARGVVRNNLQALDRNAFKGNVAGLLQKKSAQKPLASHAARNVIHIRVEGAALDIPSADQPLQARLVQSRSSMRGRTPWCVPELT